MMRAARVLDAPRTGGIATRALCWRRLGFWLCLGWLLLQVASGSVEELELELERRSSRSSGSRHTRWLKQWRWFYEYEDGWKTGQDAFLQAVSQQRLGHAPGALPRGRVPAGLFVSPKGCRRGSVKNLSLDVWLIGMPIKGGGRSKSPANPIPSERQDKRQRPPDTYLVWQLEGKYNTLAVITVKEILLEEGHKRLRLARLGYLNYPRLLTLAR
ncbi:hypothetical protein M419DRAFT_81848 [Trichoderma reesei RUT C-30]|uniref:Uncharacterized protein n=1 Tax=Hypocrea jecorina (strain ATCC 56765 / BCRC 32924 / NRRL 11460 / Rut C-30) TaxID=1344414 RepID=A0A024S7J5_HYPJR|nr:hypothetical protein M419DRAFT_81848 [Trichoderma reesei RUT C-30]